MSRVMKWIESELAKDPKLAERVEIELARLEVEQALVTLRETQGISQRELARRMGVSQPVIARIESGRNRNLGLRTLVRIASVLNGTVEITIRARARRQSRPTAKRTRSHAA
jgi:transcriptional regulator with XRE-family HTH domain